MSKILGETAGSVFAGIAVGKDASGETNFLLLFSEEENIREYDNFFDLKAYIESTDKAVAIRMNEENLRRVINMMEYEYQEETREKNVRRRRGCL